MCLFPKSFLYSQATADLEALAKTVLELGEMNQEAAADAEALNTARKALELANKRAVDLY